VRPLRVLIPDARLMEHFAIFRSHTPIFVSGISGWLNAHLSAVPCSLQRTMFFLELCLLLSCCVFLIEIVVRSLRVLFYLVTLLSLS